MTASTTLLGYLVWWDLPYRTFLSYSTVNDALVKNGYPEIVKKTTRRQAFALAVKEAKTSFSSRFKLDLIENLKTKITYGVVSRKVRDRYKCKRVIHKHHANISFNVRTKKITSSKNNPVCNYIINTTDKYTEAISAVKLVNKIRDLFQYKFHSLDLIPRGGLWFVPGIYSDELIKLHGIFNQIFKDCGATGGIRLQVQHTGGDLERAIFAVLVEKHNEITKNFSTSISFKNMSVVAKFNNVVSYIRELTVYRDAYGFEFDDLFTKYAELKDILSAALASYPNQDQKIRECLDVQ